VPVTAIDAIECSDADPLVNGHITIHAFGTRTKFAFRRKTRAEARALFEELERKIAEARGSGTTD